MQTQSHSSLATLEFADNILLWGGRKVTDIAMQVGRKLRWDPETETFANDAEANALRSRPSRQFG